MDDETPIRILIPTEKSYSEFENTTINHCLKKLRKINPGDNFSFDVKYKNKIGLSKLYNDYLDYLKDIDQRDGILVFMHDDVEIHDLWFVEKLRKAHEIYDIVGLAGATTQQYFKDKPTLWHTSMKSSQDGRGFVSHKLSNGYNSAYFGISPSEVAVIDGLFISINVKKVIENNVRFDSDFDWHHYDITWALRAKEAGMKIGVFPIFVIHHGLGFFDNDEWRKSDLKFKEKYIK